MNTVINLFIKSRTMRLIESPKSSSDSALQNSVVLMSMFKLFFLLFRQAFCNSLIYLVCKIGLGDTWQFIIQLINKLIIRQISWQNIDNCVEHIGNIHIQHSLAYFSWSYQFTITDFKLIIDIHNMILISTIYSNMCPVLSSQY